MKDPVEFMTHIRNAIVRSVGINVYWSWEVSNGNTVTQNDISGLGFRGEYENGLLFCVNGQLHKGEVLILKKSGNNYYSLYIGNIGKNGIFIPKLYEHRIDDCDLGLYIDGSVAYDYSKEVSVVA